jgi:hypothetical protein
MHIKIKIILVNEQYGVNGIQAHKKKKKKQEEDFQLKCNNISIPTITHTKFLGLITLINKFWMIEYYGYVNTLSLRFLGRRIRK